MSNNEQTHLTFLLFVVLAPSHWTEFPWELFEECYKLREVTPVYADVSTIKPDAY